MNQHDQMRELLKEARKIIRASSSRHLAKDWDVRATQTLAAEPAPLVMVTEQEAKSAYQRGIDESENRGIQSAAHWLGLKTVMDAMERMNK